MSKEINEGRGLSTADLVAAGDRRLEEERPMREELHDERELAMAQPRSEPLAALFQPEQAEQFRTRWDQVQIGFVDDPRQAVQQADELVAQVMRDMAETFASQRAAIEAEVGNADTENLRMALHRYRSFFQRLLAL
jgi:hypothetical protein